MSEVKKDSKPRKKTKAEYVSENKKLKAMMLMMALNERNKH